MFKPTLVCAILVAAANAQPQSPFGFSFGGRPASSSPFGGGPPSSSSPFGGAASSPFGGPTSSSSSPFSSGPPSIISSLGPPRGGSNRPSNFPSQGSFSPPGFGKPPRSSLLGTIGNMFSKIPGLVPKIHYHNPSKSKPQSSHGGPPSSHGPSSSPSFSPIPNSIFEDGPYKNGGSTVSFAPSSGSPPQHPPVKYRSPSGPPPPGFGSGFGGRPRGPPLFGSRPSLFGGSRPPPSYSSDRPPFSSGGPGPSPYSSGPPPSFSSDSPFSGPSSSHFPQNIRNNLEVFPSHQISYQSQTLNQNQPGYNDALSSLQNIYAQSSNKKPNYAATSHYEQQSSYSNTQASAASTNSNNYGATFHSVEPVQVAPVYDVGQNFKPSSADLSGSASQNVQQAQQQNGNIHDTPFVNLMNDYAAATDAQTSGSEQMLSALQGTSDLDTAASSAGMKILGQGTNAEGSPMFEVMTDANFDGHPVDLNKLISMIEPGAQIDSMPTSYGETGAASEQQPMYAEAPANMQADSFMSSGLLSGNKKLTTGSKSQSKIFKPSPTDPTDIQYLSLSSESRPTVVKADGTSLDSEELLKDLKEHFDKDIIIDDLQESNKDTGFIVLRMGPDNQTGDDEHNMDLSLTKINGTLSSNTRKDKDIRTDDNLLAIIQQLRKSAVVNTLENPSFNVVTPTKDSTSNHPNHNYNPPHNTIQTLNDTNNSTKDNPVINPLLDSVRPSRIRFSKSSSSSETVSTLDQNDSHLLSSKDKHDDDNVDSETGDGDDKDYEYEDMTESDSDMAVAASRNVKSVAIIVTPPPHYVKIRNKYKKPSIPLSALTSTTTILPPVAEEETTNFAEIFSESLSNNSNRNENNSLDKNVDDNGSIPTTATSFTSLEKSSSFEDDGSEDDVFLKSILRGLQNNSSNIQKDDSNEEHKKPRRYPVYRGKSS